MASVPCVTLSKWPTPEKDATVPIMPSMDPTNDPEVSEVCIVQDEIQETPENQALESIQVPTVQKTQLCQVNNNHIQAVYPAVIPLKSSIIVLQPLTNGAWQLAPPVVTPQLFQPITSPKAEYTIAPSGATQVVNSYPLANLSSTNSTWSTYLDRKPVTYPGNVVRPVVRIHPNEVININQCSIVNLGPAQKTKKQQKKKLEKEPYYKKVPLLNRKSQGLKVNRYTSKKSQRTRAQKPTVVKKNIPIGVTAYVDSVTLHKAPGQQECFPMDQRLDHLQGNIQTVFDQEVLSNGADAGVRLDDQHGTVPCEAVGCLAQDEADPAQHVFDEAFEDTAMINPTVVYELISMEAQVLDHCDVSSVLDFSPSNPRQYTSWFNTVNPQAISPQSMNKNFNDIVETGPVAGPVNITYL